MSLLEQGVFPFLDLYLLETEKTWEMGTSWLQETMWNPHSKKEEEMCAFLVLVDKRHPGFDMAY